MAKHNFQTMGPLTRYNAAGEFDTAYSDADLARMAQAGFRSSYVKSKYPTTAFNRKTGQSKPIGKLGDTDEQVAEKLKALGPDWTFDHVPEPEPVAKSAVEPTGGLDVAALLQLGGQIALLTERLSTVEAALVQSEESKVLLASRVGELEAMVTEDIPATAHEPAKSAKSASKAVSIDEPVGTGKK